MIHKLLITCLLIALLQTCAEADSREVAVMVTLESISLSQLVDWDIPELNGLIESGALGLMNNKTSSSETFENNAVTIGAGTRGRGFAYAGYGFNANETFDGECATQLYELNTGNEAGDQSIVQLGIAPILQLNSGLRYDIIPGLLGQQLGDAGITVATYGNSDQDGVWSRSAVSIAMNAEGQVPAGNVGNDTVVFDPNRPFGIRTNYEYIFRSFTDLPQDRIFATIEAGDTRRIEVWKSYLMPGRHQQLRRTAAEECARFLVELNDHLKSSTDRYLLLLVIPTQESTSFSGGDRLTPVIAVGTDIGKGLIASGTTRRPGLIANIDLAPSVLSFFDIEPHPSMLGRPISTVYEPNPASMLMTMNDQMVATFSARMPVLHTYVAILALSVLLTILAVVLPGHTSRPARLITETGFLKVLFITLMLVPLFLMLAPTLGIYKTAPSIAFVAVTAVAASYALNRWAKDPRLIFAIVGIVISAVISIDLATGAQLLKKSILSYDPITGIRTYGIGNESCGVLIGATLLGLYAALDYVKRIRWPHVLMVALACVVVLVLIGMPSGGTNFGGTLAALSGFGFALIAVHGGTSWRKAFIWTTAGAAGLLALMLGANVMLEPDKQSHIGRAFSQAHANNPYMLVDIAIRKWSMNLRVMKYSVWTYVLVSLMIGLAVLFWRPVGILKQILSKHRLLNAGFTGIIVGVLVAMVTNDSGIAMAATGLMYLAVPLMFMVKVEIEQPSTTSMSPLPATESLRE